MSPSATAALAPRTTAQKTTARPAFDSVTNVAGPLEPLPAEPSIATDVFQTDTTEKEADSSTPARSRSRSSSRSKKATPSKKTVAKKQTAAQKQSPAKSAASSRSLSAKEALKQAKLALAKGESAKAHRLAQQSYLKNKKSSTAEVMVLAACKMKSRAKAKSALNKVNVFKRRSLRSKCKKSGVNL